MGQSDQKIIETLLRAKTVCLDSMIFSYQFAKHPDFFPLTKSIFDLIESGKIHAVISTITVTEILSLPSLVSTPFLLESYKNLFLSFPHLNIIPVDFAIATEAASFRRQYPSLKTPDALLLATTLVSGAKIFLTNDLRLKQVKEIAVLSL